MRHVFDHEKGLKLKALLEPFGFEAFGTNFKWAHEDIRDGSSGHKVIFDFSATTFECVLSEMCKTMAVVGERNRLQKISDAMRRPIIEVDVPEYLARTE